MNHKKPVVLRIFIVAVLCICMFLTCSPNKPSPNNLPSAWVPSSPMELVTNGKGMRLIKAKGYGFTMGGDAGIGTMKTHRVDFTYDFFIDTTEVTQLDFFTLTTLQPWANIATRFGSGDHCAAYLADWYIAVFYCNRRSVRDGLDTAYSYTERFIGNMFSPFFLSDVALNKESSGYRLPTESEFEYACRGGTTTRSYWGESLDSWTVGSYAWCADNSGKKYHDVATRLPNAYGLYDMMGNANEWCQDWGLIPVEIDQTDPFGPDNGSQKVLRSLDGTENGAREMCSASRYTGSPMGLLGGLRCVLPVH